MTSIGMIRRFTVIVVTLALGACATAHNAPSSAVRALAPTGTLRVGLIDGAPANVVRDPASGEMKGVGYDLGRELARRLGVPFAPSFYPSIGALLDAGKTGQWDVTFNGVTAERVQYLDVTGPHLEIEFGYLIPAGSPITALSEVDRPGVRIAVPAKGAIDVLLSRTLTHAVVVRGAGLPGALSLLTSGNADVVASNKLNLFEMSRQLAGSRVLEGRVGTETQAMLVPKGREAGMAYARGFVEDAKAQGLVKAAIERAGLRGAVVAGSSAPPR